jgi:NAD(P)-dependent dehydrogenase (short-subunit alcohol dehydrogenase family)
MNSLEGRTAVLTGAGSGIGAQTARLFAHAGAKVVVSDIAVDKGKEVVAEIEADGGRAMFVEANVGNPDDVRNLMAAAVQEFGSLDVLHNHVAATQLFSADLSVTEIDIDVWDEIMRINLRGIMLGCKYAIPYMLRQERGSIINTSASRAFAGAVNWPAYGTSKLAGVGLTRYVATAYGKQGIRCNAIAPGMITSEAAAEIAGPDLLKSVLRHHLTPRLGTTDDVAKLALFLASDDSGFITGQVISVDGGITAHQPYYADSLGED